MGIRFPVSYPAPIRNWLFSLGFKARHQNLAEVPPISFIDVGLIPRLGWKGYIHFFRNFEAYRKNLKDKDWSCLTHCYPRSYYLLYYFFLFWWADYCNVLIDVVQSPERSLVAELFFRYIMEVDRLVDDPKGGKRMLMDPSRLKRNSEASGYLSAFLERLLQTEKQLDIKRQICDRFWRYRRDSLTICQDTLRPDAGLKEILWCKEITVGGLFHTWSSILGRLYCPQSSQLLVENAGVVLSNACMAMQVYEDLLDLPEDFRGQILNIFHEILKLHPEELRMCSEYVDRVPWQHLDGIWARQNLPASCRMAQEWVDHYRMQAFDVSLIQEKAMGLCQMIGKVNSHPIGI